MKIYLNNGTIDVTLNVNLSEDINKIELDPKETYALIEKALGYSYECRTLFGLHEDEYEITETYGDKADKELLRLIKIRLEKSKDQLNSVTYRRLS